MASRGSFLDENLEKLLLCAAVAFLVTYLVAYMGSEPKNLIDGDQWETQQYVGVARSAKVSGATEFAVADRTEYWDEGRPFVFVMPVKVAEFKPVALALPTPTVSRPPVPLPRPGPAFEFSSAFDRMQPGTRMEAADGEGEDEGNGQP